MYVARHRGPAACLGALRFLAAHGLTPPTLAAPMSVAPVSAAPPAPSPVDTTTDDDTNDDAPTGGGFTQDMLLADTGIALE